MRNKCRSNMADSAWRISSQGAVATVSVWWCCQHLLGTTHGVQAFQGCRECRQCQIWTFQHPGAVHVCKCACVQPQEQRPSMQEAVPQGGCINKPQQSHVVAVAQRV